MMSANKTRSDCLAVILAAGEGTRMRSSRPKVLHEVAGRSMLGHVLAAVAGAEVDRVALVVGPDRADVASAAPAAQSFTQHERRGTAHAVLAAEPAIAAGCGTLLVAFGDTPLVRPETFAALRQALSETAAAIAVLGFEAANPAGYGRLLLDGATLVTIREDKDATEAERRVQLCNGGIMAIDGTVALELLRAVRSDNAKNEYYLTDIVALARAIGRTSTVVMADEAEVLGVNDRRQLAAAEAAFQTRLRAAAMADGVTLIDPSSVTLAFDTQIGRDTMVEPNVVFGPGVTVGEGVRIRSFSHLEGANVGDGAIIGPFARLRPGTRLAEDVHVGNFVEVKAATFGRGVKANHLSYIGDATIGARTNVGAGTITCNYDGFSKTKTEIGEGVFVGSHSSLVAPVKIGAGAYIGTGSVVTEDVGADALVIARSRQVEKPGWAAAFRTKKASSNATRKPQS